MPKLPPEPPEDCAAVLPLLESYLDGELSPTENEGVREHLARCLACAEEIRLAEAIQIGLRALPELDTPPEVLARVRALAAEETAAVLPFERPAPKLPNPGRFRAVTLAAALVLALLGGLLFQLRSPRPTPPPSAATAAEIARATAEARYAFACIDRASRRAGLEIKDEVLPAHLIAPAARGLSRSLGETLNSDSESAPRQGS